MPVSASRPCSHPGCRALVSSGYCAAHQHLKPKAWGNRSAASENRLRGRKLQKARAILFKSNPLCVKCDEKGITRLATKRDHIIPLFEGGTDDPENIQGLCDDCHDEKTHEESRRGRVKSLWP